MTPFVAASGLDWLTVSVADSEVCERIKVRLLLAVAETFSERDTPDGSGTLSAHTDYTWFGERLPIQVNRSGVVLHLADGVHVQLFLRSSGCNVQVTVYSACLWSHAFDHIDAELRSLVGDLADVPGYVPLYPTRVDLCADVAGVDMDDISAPEWLNDRLVSRCSTASRVYASLGDDEVPSLSVISRRRRVESLYIGSVGGAVRWNWYDKLADVRAKGHADRYASVWSASGFCVPRPVTTDVCCPLTRFEVRLNAEFMREFRSPLCPDERLEMSNLLASVPSLWAYLTSHTRLIDPDSGSGNRSRATLLPLWSLISSAFRFLSRPGRRVAVNDLRCDRLSAQLSGVAISLLALVRVSDLSIEDLGAFVAAVVSEHASRRGGLRSAVRLRQARLGIALAA